MMLKRFKLIKQDLKTSSQWAFYREEDVGKAVSVKEKVLDDIWWDNIDYILYCTSPMYDMIRSSNTDKPSLHLVYDIGIP